MSNGNEPNEPKPFPEKDPPARTPAEKDPPKRNPPEKDPPGDDPPLDAPTDRDTAQKKEIKL
jgi:hypothetical protein